MFGIIELVVIIKNIENVIVDWGFVEGWIKVVFLLVCSRYKVVIVGFGLVGFVVVAQFNIVGYQVTVYECVDRIGGLLMYGIFNMKLEK